MSSSPLTNSARASSTVLYTSPARSRAMSSMASVLTSCVATRRWRCWSASRMPRVSSRKETVWPSPRGIAAGAGLGDGLLQADGGAARRVDGARQGAATLSGRSCFGTGPQFWILMRPVRYKRSLPSHMSYNLHTTIIKSVNYEIWRSPFRLLMIL